MSLLTRLHGPWLPVAVLTTLCGLAAGSGCAPSNKAGVTGTVTLGGKPIENVRVTFTPDRGPGGAGNTAADGTYTLFAGPRDKGFVVIGPCRVHFTDLNSDLNVAPRLPLHYLSSATSGFAVDLKPGPNVCDFDLEANPAARKRK
ncbi:MAG: hypothetical protein ACKOHG_00450 [Planctomycetia bacterium]